jgi:hypothetical protein
VCIMGNLRKKEGIIFSPPVFACIGQSAPIPGNFMDARSSYPHATQIKRHAGIRDCVSV